MRKIRNYSTQKVKPIGQITTSRTSQKGRNKFRIKSQKTKITYKSKTIMVRPRKLVAPVPDKVQYTHQAKIDTHQPSDSESEHSKRYRKAESNPKVANYNQHNQS